MENKEAREPISKKEEFLNAIEDSYVQSKENYLISSIARYYRNPSLGRDSLDKEIAKWALLGAKDAQGSVSCLGISFPYNNIGITESDSHKRSKNILNEFIKKKILDSNNKTSYGARDVYYLENDRFAFVRDFSSLSAGDSRGSEMIMAVKFRDSGTAREIIEDLAGNESPTALREFLMSSLVPELTHPLVEEEIRLVTEKFKQQVIEDFQRKIEIKVNKKKEMMSDNENRLHNQLNKKRELDVSLGKFLSNKGRIREDIIETDDEISRLKNLIGYYNDEISKLLNKVETVKARANNPDQWLVEETIKASILEGEKLCEKLFRMEPHFYGFKEETT